VCTGRGADDDFTDVAPDKTWVTAAERMQPRSVEKRSSDNRVWIAKIKWNAEKR